VQVQHQHALAIAHSRSLLDATALALWVETLDRPTPPATTAKHLSHLPLKKSHARHQQQQQYHKHQQR
jgi:hypothetical protein